MAFIGLIMMYLVIILLFLAFSLFTCATCFIVSGVIMLKKRHGASQGIKIKQPWYVVVLRVVGAIAACPVILAIIFVIYSAISSSIDNRTNLAKAVSRYDYELAEDILQDGADPDQRDKEGKTLLMCLACHRSYITEENSMRYDFDCETDANGEFLYEDDIRMMELLIEYGADINAQQYDCGDNSLHTYGDESWNGVCANSDHACGNTPLIFAVRYSSPEVVSFLIENGADVNLPNSCGFTPALMCADNRIDDDGVEILGLLIDAGADLSVMSNFHQDIRFLVTRNNGDYVNEMLAEINAAGTC